jgi:hypothetical protein
MLSAEPPCGFVNAEGLKFRGRKPAAAGTVMLICVWSGFLMDVAKAAPGVVGILRDGDRDMQFL